MKDRDFGRPAIDGGQPVRTDPLPWELPGVHFMGDEELALVCQVILARSPFRYYGPDPQGMVRRFEEAFGERVGLPWTLAVNSGTAALLVALAAIDVAPGDEVLVPGYAWTSCYAAIVRLGAIPRLVDIDDTFCMDPADLAAKVGRRTRAILFVHMNGASGRIEEVARIANNTGVPLVEDCAQAIGAKASGRPAGSFGDLATFSFQANKHITAGEGGLVACRTEALHRRCTALHDLGYARTSDGRLDLSAEDIQGWGMGNRMSEITAAVLLAQLGKLDRILSSMRQAKAEIRRGLEGLRGLSFRTVLDPDGDCGSSLISVHRSAEACRRFHEALVAEGIRGPDGALLCAPMEGWGLHWHFNNASLVAKRPVARDGFPWTHPANAFARSYRYERGVLPACDDLCARSMILNVPSALSDRDVRDIIVAFGRSAVHLGAPA